MNSIIIFSFISLFVFVTILPSSAGAGIQINSHGKKGGAFLSKATVPFIVIDTQGHRVGYDPRSNQEYNEFEGSYGTSGIDDIYTEEAYIKPVDGNYMIEVIGEGLMEFSISFAIFRDKSEGMKSFIVQGLTDKGLTSKFQMTYNSDPSQPVGSVVRVASPSSLKQDIALSRKIGWIDSDGIMMSLYKKAEAIEKSISKGDNGTAKNQLEALINEINAQKGKHINDEAVKMLLEDAQYLMEHL